MRNKNKVVSRTKLVEHVYDYHFDTETNIIDVFINKLRAKIETGTSTPLINTIRGVDYDFIAMRLVFDTDESVEIRIFKRMVDVFL